MNIALVSCGPSASAFSESDHEGPIIAVSRMATKIRCDYWACFDLPVALELADRVIGFPRLFTIADTLSSLARRKSRWCEVAVVAETLGCPVDKWAMFTAPACLILAAAMGANRINCWGVDMRGADDATATAGNPDVNRTEGRWERERAIWNGVEEWLKGKGVEVERMNVGLSAR